MRNITKHVSIVIVVMVICMLSSVSTVSAASKKTLNVTMEVRSKNHASVVKTLQVKQKGYLVVKHGGKKVTSKITYKTNNKKVATVNKKGIVTGKKAGKCTITVKYKGKVKKFKITVKAGTGGTSNNVGGNNNQHVHDWKPFYEERRVEQLGVHDCNCHYQILQVYNQSGLEKANAYNTYRETKGMSPLPVDIEQDPSITGVKYPLSGEHSINHILNKEPSNYSSKRLYKIVKYVDGYECECGAEKEPDGNEPEIFTGEYVIDW